MGVGTVTVSGYEAPGRLVLRGQMLIAPFMGGMFRQQNEGFVANLKRVLEGS